MANYKFGHINFEENRVELHDMLSLTGAEISYNSLPAGAGVPFVHSLQVYNAFLESPKNRRFFALS